MKSSTYKTLARSFTATWLDASWKNDGARKMSESWADIDSCSCICFWSYVVDVYWTYDTLKKVFNQKKTFTVDWQKWPSCSTDIKQCSVLNLTNENVKVTVVAFALLQLFNFDKVRSHPDLWKKWKIFKVLESIFHCSFFLTINFLLRSFSILKTYSPRK